MTKMISQSLKDRAEKVGLTVNDTQAHDGTYWIPSLCAWRSIDQIAEIVADREDNRA